MLQTIIIGIDGRAQDAEALALARRLADPGAELIAVSVAVIDHLVMRAAMLETDADIQRDAETVVDAFTELRGRTEGLSIRATSVGQGLASVARGARADLIVVSSSRRGRFGRAFAGDSVRDVLRHAPCAVAIAPVGYNATGPIEAVVVGDDGTPESERARRLADELAHRDGGRVDSVQVIAPATADDVAAELTRACAQADLLSIGLHEHGILDRLRTGSIAHVLLREQPAPLLVTGPHLYDSADHPPTDGLDSATSPDARDASAR